MRQLKCYAVLETFYMLFSRRRMQFELNLYSKTPQSRITNACTFYNCMFLEVIQY